MKGGIHRSSRPRRDGRGEKGRYCSNQLAGSGANQNCPYRRDSRQGALQPVASFVSGFFRYVQLMIEREVERVRIKKAEQFTLPEEQKEVISLDTASRKRAELMNPEKTATDVNK